MKNKREPSPEKPYKYTLKLPRELSQEARKLAIDKEITFARLMEEALREKILSEAKKGQSKK